MGIRDFFKMSGEQWGLGSRHLEGLNGVDYNTSIALRTWPEKKHVVLKCQEEQIVLPFTQIVQINFITWEKTFARERSPTGEAFIGGLIGGEAMAIASAIEAKGKTKAEKVKVTDALEIQYRPRGDYRTIKSIIVDPGHPRSHAVQWAETLCRCAGLPGPQYITPQPKGPTYL